MVDKNKRTPLLQRRNWFVSAGLLFALYLIMLYVLTHMGGDNHLLILVCHALPLIAVLMVLLGFLEKRQQEDQHRERARKRYEARMEISRIQRQTDALTRQKEPTNKSGGNKDESK